MTGVIIFTTIAFLIGLVLALTNYYLNKEDKRVEEVKKLLPGYNCGACGFGGCKDMAINIVNKGVDPKLCKTIKDEQYSKLKEYLDDHDIKQVK